MSIIEIFLKRRKLKKKYANTKKSTSDVDSQRKKEYMKNYYKIFFVKSFS